MLDWLKPILGDGYNEEIDNKIAAEINKGFVAKADYDAAKDAQRTAAEALKDRIGLRTMLDAVENGRIEAVMVRDLEQISRNSYILVGVIEILRQNDVYLITTECDLNAELINSGLERFVGDRFTRASFGKPRFDVRLPLMDQF